MPAPVVLEDRAPKPVCSLSARQVLCHGLAGAEQLESDAHSMVCVLLGFPAVLCPQGGWVAVPQLLLRAGGGICCWVALAGAHAAALSPVSSQVRCQHVFSAKPPAQRQAHSGAMLAAGQPGMGGEGEEGFGAPLES